MMAECVSGDVTVLIMDKRESKVLMNALMHLWEDDDKYLIIANEWERGTLRNLMDSIGVE
jgi:hypothetical protein